MGSCLFSKAKYILSDQRTRMLPKHLEIVLFLTTYGTDTLLEVVLENVQRRSFNQ